jgi:hypothetical protein
MAMRMGFSSLVYHEDVTVGYELWFVRRWAGGIRLTQRDTGEERSLSQADEEATHCESSSTGHCWHADRADTPGHHHGWQKPSWVGFGKPQISWKLANQITHIKRRYASVPDSVVHVQVLL